MKTKKLFLHRPYFIALSFILILFSNALFSQQDIRVKITDTDINQLLLAATNSRSINFGDYKTTFATKGYFLNLDGATIHFIVDKKATISASATFVEVLQDWLPGNEQQPIHGSVTITGDIILRQMELGYKLFFKATSVNLSAFGISLSESQFASKMPEVELNSGTKILPDAITSSFINAIPTFTTNEGEAIFYYTFSGPRQIKVYNDVNQKDDVGFIEEVVSGTPSSFQSPKTFWWGVTETHQLQTPQQYLTETNGMNKYKNWFKGEETAPQSDIGPRRIQITVDGDLRYKAKFPQAQHVQLSNLLEGSYSGGTVSYTIDGNTTTGVTFDDYDYKDFTRIINSTVSNGTLGVNWNFMNWSDGVSSQSRGLVVTSNINLVGNYKAIQATNNALAIKSNGQRKIIRKVNGDMYSAYESMGEIWLERKVSGGSDWALQYVSNLSSTEASNPSAAIYGDKLLLVYQQKNGNNNTDLKLSIIDENETVTIVDISLDIPTYSNNCSPVVASTQNGKILIVWKQGSAGLFYRFGQYENGVFVWKINTVQLTDDAGVAANAINPTLAAENTTFYPYDGFYHFHLAFQSGSHIYYRQLQQRVNGNFEALGTSTNVSSTSGYSSNYQPSIISFDDGARLAWYGRRWEPSEEGLAKSAIEEGEWIYNTILTDPSNPTYFWSWGNNVGSVSFNKYTVGTDDQNYVIGWTENNGASAKYMRSISFSEINTFVQPSGTAITGSKDIQVTNGESFGTMYGYFLTEGSPNKFVLSKDLLPIQSKQQSQPIYSGREGIITKDSAQFYFTFGDILVDGKLIKFKTIPDTTNIDSLPIVNQYLTTENFNLTGQSNFLYGVRYGITDSLAATAALQNGNTVRFNVELIDAQTEQVIGTYDDIEYTENNVFQYDNIGYQVNTSGIGSRVVKLRLKVSSSDSVHYSIAERYDTEVFLGKRGSNRVAIGYQGSNVITSYSLEQNYPNPFNPTTTINYALPKSGNVVLKVYDVLGKEVATLINDFKETGRYQVEFDASKLSSGMYIYKLTSDKFTEVKKMMLVK